MTLKNWPLAQFEVPLEHFHHAEPIVTVMSAHLELEGLLIETCKQEWPHASVFDFDRIAFAQLARLAAATGAIDCEMLEPALVLNAIRNRLAHRRRARLERADIDQLHNALMKAGFTRERFASEETMQQCFAALATMLIAYVQCGSYERLLIRGDASLRSDGPRLASAVDAFARERWPISPDP